MMDKLQRVPEISGCGLAALPEEVVTAERPTVLRGLAIDWPFVRTALRSDDDAVAYLDRFYNGQPVTTVVAPASQHGRFFYQPGSTAMNFQTSVQSLTNVLKGILQQRHADEPLAIAMQAVRASECLPGLEEDNPNPFVPEGTRARVWIGNAATVAPHFDATENLAIVMAGRRRFVLFPPEQTPNLYPGPMHPTPANVPISMVPLDAPDLERFPRYANAMEAGFVADLEPGDAIYIPYLWWHGVQSLAPFNILMNYWWHRDEVGQRHAYATLLHLAFLLYRDVPPEQRKAWRALYDHYVFQTEGDPMAALDPAHRYRGPTLDAERLARFQAALRELVGE